MDTPVIVAVITFILLLVFLLSSLWVAVGLALVAVLGFHIWLGNSGLTPFVPFEATNSFILTAIPLFIFMGEILVHCGISEMLYRGASRWLAWAPGGLLHSNIGACAFFAAISGSSPATAATIGTVALPSLKKRGYDTKLSLGSLAAGGTLGILIPPSISLIVYGYLAEVSVGKLFAGGILPGVILSGMFITYIGIRAIKNPNIAPKEMAFSAKGLVLSFLDFWPFIILMTIVLGGIFGGLVTPTEAAALGTSAALLIALGMRRLTWKILRDALMSALETSCMVMFIVWAAKLVATFLAVMQVPAAFAEVILGSGLSPLVILLLIYLLYLFLGCFIDGLSAMIMTLATILPIISALGYDVIWFGVILTVLIEVGMLTPPMGVNLFVIQGLSKRPLGEVIAGSVPFFLIMILGVALFTWWPGSVLWLSNLIMGG
jgi:tripartite ATP-independent transporter DctM subunit